MPAAATDRAVGLLSADFSRLGEACVALEDAGADRLQWDVMDGHFASCRT